MANSNSTKKLLNEQVPPLTEDEIRYTISKQTSSMEYIHTAYGDLDLDSELFQAVQEALDRVLYKRIDERPPVDTLVVELADVQRDELNKMVNLTGVSDESLAQLMFDHGFESWDSLVRLVKDK